MTHYFEVGSHYSIFRVPLQSNVVAFQCTKSTKLNTFHFKFLHRRISTNNVLKKIGLIDSEKCTFCERETEKLTHLFRLAQKLKFFGPMFKYGYSLAKSLPKMALNINPKLTAAA